MKNFTKAIIGMAWSLALASAVFPACALAYPVAVVSSKSPLGNVTKDEVANLFLGNSDALGGQHAIPVALKEGNPVRNAFYLKFTGKSADLASKFFAKQVLTGKAMAMNEAASDAEIKSWVIRNDHAVGMIDSASLDASVKVVTK